MCEIVKCHLQLLNSIIVAKFRMTGVINRTCACKYFMQSVGSLLILFPPFSKVIKIHYMCKHCHNVHTPEMPCTSIKRPPSRSYWSTPAVSDELLSVFPPNVLNTFITGNAHLSDSNLNNNVWGPRVAHKPAAQPSTAVH